MKRVIFVLLLVMMAAWILSARRAEHARRAASHAHYHQVQGAMEKARHELQHSLHKAHQDVRQALHEAHREVRETFAEIDDDAFAEAWQRSPASPPRPDPDTLPRFPGLMTHSNPPAPPRPPVAAVPALPERGSAASAKAETTRTIVGLVSATEERAQDEARKQLNQEVATWLELHGVPRSWSPPSRLIDDMIFESSIRPIVKDYGTVYEAQLKVDVSPERRALFHQSYQQQLVHGRLVLLGGALAFILTCLAAVSGYIRADEVTRGYYTNRLRLLAAAGVGAAGMAIYHALV